MIFKKDDRKKVKTARTVNQLYRHNEWTVVFEEKGEIIINAGFFEYVTELEHKSKRFDDSLLRKPFGKWQRNSTE